MDVASLDNFEQSRQWIDECHEKHPICRGSSQSMLPKRVLRISHDGKIVFLVEPGRGYDGKYAALSYCWGPYSQKVITTLATLEKRKKGIHVSELPKTLQDAVRATRMLKLDYLWVDSLCILQHDPNSQGSDAEDAQILDDPTTRDQADEIPRMSEIYYGAHVTISAACAEACQQGFLHRRTPEIASIPLVDRDGRLNVMNVYQSFGVVPEPIHKRAWTLQEHVLSCRILDFGTQELRRICRGDPDHQTEVLDHENPATYDPSTIDKSVWAFQMGPDDVLKIWRKLVLDFTAREIGRGEDRAKAIQGIAIEYEKIFKVKYLAGLWDGRFFTRDLLWERASRKPTDRPKRLFVPTWSWLSVQNTMISWRQWPVDYRVSGFTVDKVQVDQYVGYPGARPERSTLLITGCLGVATWSAGRRFLVLPGGTEDQIVAETMADAIEPDLDLECPTSVTALEILKGSRESDCVGLLLLYDGERSRYRRVGIFWTREGRDKENTLRWLGGFTTKRVAIQ